MGDPLVLSTKIHLDIPHTNSSIITLSVGSNGDINDLGSLSFPHESSGALPPPNPIRQWTTTMINSTTRSSLLYTPSRGYTWH